MDQEILYKLFYENPKIITSVEKDFDDLVNDLLNYNLDDVLKKLKNIKWKQETELFFKAKVYYYKYDLEGLNDILNNKDVFPQLLYQLLKVEYLLLKRKVQELSGYSRLSNEISKLVIQLSNNSDTYIQSIAKTFEGDNFSLINEYYSAQNSYKEALFIDENNLRAKIGYAKSLYYLEMYEEAKKELEILAKSYKNSSIKKYLGKICKKSKDTDQAVKLLNETIDQDMYYMDAHFDLFEVYRKAKHKKEANETILKIQNKFPYFTNTSEFKYYNALNYYLQDQFDKALVILKKLSKLNYESYYTLYLIGKILSKKAVGSKEKKERYNVLKEAQDYFELAIEHYSNEIELLKNTEEINIVVIKKLDKQLDKCKYSSAITLSHLDKYNESINILFELLERDPDNYYLIKSIAITYTQSRDYDEAINYFEKSIGYFNNEKVKIYNNSKAALLREYAYCLLKKKRYKDGLNWIKKALELNEKDYKIHLTLGEILFYLKDYKSARKYTELYLNNDQELKYDDLATENLKLIEYAEAGRSPIEREIKKKEIIEKFNSLGIKGNEIKEAEDRFQKRINLPKTITEQDNYLLILRKWNSYTPILNITNSKGGGYFICYKGQGIIIDPGLNFLENFFTVGLSLKDINHIFISHAHNDHMADLESIITLLYKYNSSLTDSEKDKEHKISLYMNIGSYKKYITNLNLKDKTSINKIFVLNPDIKLEIDENIKIETIKANHDEILSDSYCLSFVFRLGNKTITFTNDSGYTNEYGSKIEDSKPDILIAHIGTIKEFEFKELKYYTKHLGINGLMEILDKSEAEINIVSEFGEELKHLRGNIAKSLSEVYNKTVIPGDIGIKININELTIRESFPSKFPPEENIDKMTFLKPSEIIAKESFERIFIYNKEIKDPDKYFAEVVKNPAKYISNI